MKLIKTMLSFIIMSALVLNSFCAFAVEFGSVSCNVLNVRVSPNTECEIIDRLYNGTVFEIIYTDNGWYNIKLANNLTGFVCADYVTRSSDIIGAKELDSMKANVIVQNAHKYIGYPYSYGSSGPNAFDCSGFTTYLFKEQGISLPRSSRDQGAYGTYVEKSDLTAGDLLFFSNRSDRVINHVGLYIGNGDFIHASTSLRGVVKDSLSSDYYIRNYITARRVL